MTYTVSYSIEFKKNLGGFPKPDQMKIALFVAQFQKDGLADHSKYPGKIAVSWGGLQPPDPRFTFTHGNDLWHYHIGIPTYIPARSQSYLTSDWLLHFQWPNWQKNGTHIHLVDLLQHDDSSGVFNLPRATALP